MMIFIKCFFAFVVVFFMATGSLWASGSGAYRLEVADAGASGKGSAFVGEANTPAAVYYNPAGMTQIKGQALSLGASLIQPHVDYQSNAGDKSQLQRGNFVIPAAFYVTDLGTEKFALGLGALSSWGLTTQWNSDSFARYSATKSVMENQDYLITAAYKMNEQFSFALSMDIDISHVDKQKKLYQGIGDGNFRLKGEDEGYGYRLATMYRLNERHQFGLMYRSPIELKYKGKVNLSELNGVNVLDLAPPYGLGNEDSSFSGVFGGSSYETDVIAKSTLPESVVLGYSYKPTDKWIFNMDLEWMNWSTTNKEELAYPTETDAARLAVLNDGNPAPRDWESRIAVALGAEYDMNERLRLRGGYYYRQSPIPTQNWEPNLPDADSHALTAGGGYDISKNLTLDLAWSGILYKEREVQNTVADATAAVTGGIDGKYKQWTNLLYATLTYKF